MIPDFFDSKCLSKSASIEFGICDQGDGSPAYLNDNRPKTWIAIVDNADEIDIHFFAIDNCLNLKKSNGDLESTCDGVMSYSDRLIFVELKETRRSKYRDGINQLKNTIRLFASSNDLSIYNRPQAYLANRKHPKFAYSQKEEMQRFRNDTKVRLIIANRIIIKGMEQN